MKKTWRRKRSGIQIPRFFIIVGLVFFLGWALVSATAHLVPGVLESVFGKTTVFNTATASVGQSVFSFFKDKSELEARVKRLEDSEVSLQLQLQISSFIEEENRLLKEVLEYAPVDGVLAGVVAWPPKTAYDVLLIEGIEGRFSVGDLVLGRGTTPIGQVERVEGRYAYVTLFSQGGVVTQVRAGEDRIPLELTGRGGGAAVIVAPKDVPIVQGDPIFFPYNGNTLLGHVGAVESDPAASTKNVWLVFPKHFYAYTWVSVVPYLDI